MKTTMIASLAVALGLTAGLPALALPKAVTGAVILLDHGTNLAPSLAVDAGQDEAVIILARRGSDDGDDHDSDDDHGGDRDRGSDDSSARSSDDNGTVKASGRKKPRVKGGSGCDDAGDIAEHADCR